MLKRITLISLMTLVLGHPMQSLAAPAAAEPTQQQSVAMLQQAASLNWQQAKGIMGQYKQQMKSLYNQKNVLMMQIKGKIVTPGATWDDISKLVNELNAIKGQLLMLKMKAKYEVFQKTGLAMPCKHHRHKYRGRSCKKHRAGHS